MSFPPLEWLASADRWLLLKINRDWTHPALDALMPLVTDIHKVPWFRYGAAPGAFALWLWKGGKRALQVLAVAALAVAAADLVAYRAVKPWVARPRPARTLSAVVVRAPAASYDGFPSNHAANAAAAGAVLSVAYPGFAFAFAAAAALVGYSRVYVGAHYPGDVMGGLLLGFLIGWPWARLMLGGGCSCGKTSRKKRDG